VSRCITPRSKCSPIAAYMGATTCPSHPDVPVSHGVTGMLIPLVHFVPLVPSPLCPLRSLGCSFLWFLLSFVSCGPLSHGVIGILVPPIPFVFLVPMSPGLLSHKVTGILIPPVSFVPMSAGPLSHGVVGMLVPHDVPFVPLSLHPPLPHCVFHPMEND